MLNVPKPPTIIARRVKGTYVEKIDVDISLCILVHVGFPSAFSDQKKNTHDGFYNHT